MKRFNPIVTRGLFMALSLLCVPWYATAAIKVSTDLSLSTDNWYPLPEPDMKAAAGDTALAALSNGGVFELTGTSAAGNRLVLQLSLIGPAETAKLTIHANISNQPTYVSTASISLRDLDYKGIYDALEHIGLTAAQRLNDKIEALVVEPVATAGEPQGGPEDARLRTLYDRAQRLKRQYDYKQSRILFEQVAASAAEGASLKALADDELRYGLTVFEAKQAVVAMGMSPEPAAINANIGRAENLYRQVLAENSDNLERTQEAQAALDNLLVSKNAVKASVNAQSMMTARSLEMLMRQQYFMTFNCPDKQELESLSKQIRDPVRLVRISGRGGAKVYTLRHEQSGGEIRLSCGDGDVALMR